MDSIFVLVHVRLFTLKIGIKYFIHVFLLLGLVGHATGILRIAALRLIFRTHMHIVWASDRYVQKTCRILAKKWGVGGGFGWANTLKILNIYLSP